MDTRNEYRVVPSIRYNGQWIAEFRAPRFRFGRQVGWRDWEVIDFFGTEEIAEEMCRRHAGEGTKLLGRLP